jgi:hypothetical protein
MLARLEPHGWWRCQVGMETGLQLIADVAHIGGVPELFLQAGLCVHPRESQQTTVEMLAVLPAGYMLCFLGCLQEHPTVNLPPSITLSMIADKQNQGGKNSSSAAAGRPSKVQARSKQLPPQPVVVDATFVGGYTRFMNHCCDPNCRAVKVCLGHHADELLRGGDSSSSNSMMIVLLETLRDVLVSAAGVVCHG